MTGTSTQARSPFDLGELPVGRAMSTIDEQFVDASPSEVFDVVRQVEHWPAYLSHYRWVRYRERASDGGGVVEMAAWRPFGVVGWPTWWLSQMAVYPDKPSIRFRHIGGVTKGMDVEWTFLPEGTGTRARVVHVWDGPRWPLIGVFAATAVIGPIFIHGIASRTLAGLAKVAEQR